MTKALLALATITLTATALHSAPIEGADTPQALVEEIETLLAAASHEGVAAVLVEQRSPDHVIFALNEQLPMTPASNSKLHVTAAALSLFGADHVRTTRLLANGPIEDGVLRGDLIVVGDGDPTISGRFNGGNIIGTLEDWARALRDEHGVRVIEGDVIGDDDLLDDQLIHPSWFMSELGEWYSAESSALSLNDNCVDIHWRAGDAVGDVPTFSIEPATPYLDFVVEARTMEEDADTDRYYLREHESNTVRVTGGIPLSEETTDWASVHNPTLFTVTVLADVLSAEGIEVLGDPVDIDDTDRDTRLADTHELIATPSQPMSAIIDVINKNSQNLYADIALKLIGAEAEGEGSFEAGVRHVRAFLSEIGALPEDDAWVMVDGSGLSPDNRTTARCLVSVLRHMDTRDDADVFRASLPQGRADRGSLRRRFGQSPRHRAVASQILGKTGYIGGVWSLTGIIENQAGVEMYYSIILNGYASESAPPLRLIDDIAVAVAASQFTAEEDSE